MRINKVSAEVLEDSAVNLPSLLGTLFTNGLGRTEDQQGIEGDGSTEPLGLRTTGAPQGDIADMTDLITLAAPTVQEILNNFYELPEQWRDNASWFTTSSFMARLAGIGATAAGIHVFQELIRTEPNPTLLGKPIFLFDGTGWDDAATIAANEEIGAFGDFSNYYFIDRVGMSIRRLDELFAANDQIGFSARVRFDSFFAENDAFRIIKAAAS
jgi:HK97 family phage major capsid protein